MPNPNPNPNPSSGPGGDSRSTSWQRERILTPDDLAALPGDRVIIQLAASKPLLVRKAFAGNSPYAADIARSQELYGSGAPAPILEDTTAEDAIEVAAEHRTTAQLLTDTALFDPIGK